MVKKIETFFVIILLMSYANMWASEKNSSVESVKFDSKAAAAVGNVQSANNWFLNHVNDASLPVVGQSCSINGKNYTVARSENLVIKRDTLQKGSFPYVVDLECSNQYGDRDSYEFIRISMNLEKKANGQEGYTGFTPVVSNDVIWPEVEKIKGKKNWAPVYKSDVVAVQTGDSKVFAGHKESQKNAGSAVRVMAGIPFFGYKTDKKIEAYSFLLVGKNDERLVQELRFSERDQLPKKRDIREYVIRPGFFFTTIATLGVACKLWTMTGRNK